MPYLSIPPNPSSIFRAADNGSIANANNNGDSGHPYCVPRKSGNGVERWLFVQTEAQGEE